jgi:transcriptional regulator with XRE-family HTH domain
MGDDRPAPRHVGDQVRRFRRQRGMTLAQLAEASGLSKGYLSSIETGHTSRPSGDTLYRIAQALGVLMSDLLDRRLLSDPPEEIPESLKEFAREFGLPQADLRMLANIQFRGEQPQTKERWIHIYSAIRESAWMDQEKRQA